MQIIQSISRIAGNVTRSILETIQCLLIRLILLLTVFKRSGLFLVLNLSSGPLSLQLVLVVRVIGWLQLLILVLHLIQVCISHLLSLVLSLFLITFQLLRLLILLLLMKQNILSSSVVLNSEKISFILNLSSTSSLLRTISCSGWITAWLWLWIYRTLCRAFFPVFFFPMTLRWKTNSLPLVICNISPWFSVGCSLKRSLPFGLRFGLLVTFLCFCFSDSHLESILRVQLLPRLLLLLFFAGRLYLW